MTIKQQERAWLARQLTEEGRRFLEAGRTKEAYRSFSKALDLDPKNDAAQELKTQAGQVLGRRREQADDAFRNAVEMYRVKVQQALVEVRSLYGKGKQHYAKAEYEDAINCFESVLNIIRWMPYHVDLTGYKNLASMFIKNSKRLKRSRDLEMRRRNEQITRKLAENEERKRRERLEGRIRILFENANLQFSREQYGETERLCRQILRLDPYNRDARMLQTIAKESRHSKESDKNLATLRENWKQSFEDIEMAMVPQVDVVAFPDYDEWRDREERARRILSGTSDSGEISVGEQKIRRTLDTKTISLDFTDTPLKAVVRFLQDVSGINIIVSPGVYDEKSEEDLMVTLQVEDIPLRQALDLILSMRELAFTVTNGVLLVTTTEKAVGNSILRVYDIRDLLVKLEDFAGVDIKLASGDDMGGAPPMMDEEEGEGLTTEIIENLIRENIASESWDTPPNQITLRQGNLIIRNQTGVHKAIIDLLDNLRSQVGLLVSVEARFITVEDNFLEDIGVDLRGLGNQLPVGSPSVPGRGGSFTGSPGEPTDDVPFGSNTTPLGAGTSQDSGVFFDDKGDGDLRTRVENLFDKTLGDPSILSGSGGMSMQWVYLDDVQIEAIWRSVRKTERVNLVTAPRVTAFNTQRVNVSLLNQISYVRDFDVEVAQLQEIGDPVMGRIDEGVILDVRPIVSADRRYITLELRPTVAKVVRPIATFQTTLGSLLSTPVFLHLPELRLQKVQTTVTVPDGGTILIGSMKLAREEDMKSEVPFFRHIPVLNFFFSRKSRVHNRKNLIILVKASIVMLEEEEIAQTR
jgi:type II secretory pathway component GspD/PulD (secretin)/Flp pilus assembly protein TadD